MYFIGDILSASVLHEGSVGTISFFEPIPMIAPSRKNVQYSPTVASFLQKK